MPCKMENQHKWDEAIQMLAAGDYNGVEICKKIGISTHQYYRWRKEKEFQDDLKKAIKERMTDYVGIALTNIVELANHAGSETVKLSANKEILEKFGITSKQEIELNAVQEIVIDIFGGDTDVESEDKPADI